jgi:Fe2+ or Zn2+ uptake regulation protein
MLGWLRSTDCHPTAAQIRDALSREKSRQSLATVYRNLEVLVAEGDVREVACEHGPSRYDGNLHPHHHFTCEACDRIVDVELATPRGLIGRLAGTSRLNATRVSIHFYGLCEDCETERDTSSASRET